MQHPNAIICMYLYLFMWSKWHETSHAICSLLLVLNSYSSHVCRMGRWKFVAQHYQNAMSANFPAIETATEQQNRKKGAICNFFFLHSQVKREKICVKISREKNTAIFFFVCCCCRCCVWVRCTKFFGFSDARTKIQRNKFGVKSKRPREGRKKKNWQDSRCLGDKMRFNDSSRKFIFDFFLVNLPFLADRFCIFLLFCESTARKRKQK